LRQVTLPWFATTFWAGISCGQSSWEYVGLIGLLNEYTLPLVLLSHVGAGKGDDVREIAGGRRTIYYKEYQGSGTPVLEERAEGGGPRSGVGEGALEY